ncbi:hypothetical protein CBR_g21822 [Chara braunii]|uniref:Uncharacterized protein n=1 Tax=Chara braunii TaxID=69332 RepID=A0A388JUJ9_CHABU|nr:hypothetical protein CBR_g21822 [Chara braunii]|eukprot:GBG61478.1 hypothetical protein CBR_g21822 [Chara braunii]
MSIGTCLYAGYELGASPAVLAAPPRDAWYQYHSVTRRAILPSEPHPAETKAELQTEELPAVRRAVRFRPCIDIHKGKVKQIVGSTLKDLPSHDDGDGTATAAANEQEPVTNFESEKSSAEYARLYANDGLDGGHVIMLGADSASQTAALGALAAYPGGMHVGGGINAENARVYLDAGASHVIVTSDGKYMVVTDRWQKFSDVALSAEALEDLAAFADEFLVHGVDVEGMKLGIDEELVRQLGLWSPIPVTYAGGARTLSDLERVKEAGDGTVDITVGSALDIFGGQLPYTDVVAWHRQQQQQQQHQLQHQQDTEKQSSMSSNRSGFRHSIGCSLLMGPWPCLSGPHADKRREEKRREEKRRGEERRGEEKRREEKRREEKRREEKRRDETRRDETRGEERRGEEKRGEERRGEERRGEKRGEEGRREEKRGEEKRGEEKRGEERRREERRREERRGEEKRGEERRREERRREEKSREEQRRGEERRGEERRGEERRREEKRGEEERRGEERRGEKRRREERRKEERRGEEKRREEKRREEKRREEKRREERREEKRREEKRGLW